MSNGHQTLLLHHPPFIWQVDLLPGDPLSPFSGSPRECPLLFLLLVDTKYLLLDVIRDQVENQMHMH